MAQAEEQASPTAAPRPSRAATWHQDLFATIGRWPWLSTLNDRVTAIVSPWYERLRGNVAVEVLHGGRWAGHALHPALSDVPIGFWLGAVVLETVGQDEPAPGRRWGPASTLSAAGLVGAVGAVASGVADWNVSDGEDRKIGLFHGVLNTAGMALQGASLAARMSGHRAPARVLSVTSVSVTAAAGFVGGHLVQGRGAMVNRVVGASGPTRWVQAMADADLHDGELAGVEVEGRRVLLYREGAEVHAIDNTCSHAGGVLSRGEINGCVVTCPLHGARFDVRDGHVVRGPAHHPQPVLPARIRNGQIEVRGSQPRARRATN